MESMREQGCAVGEYVGNGQGELEESLSQASADLDAVGSADALAAMAPPF